MKIESSQFKKILRHTSEYDTNYRNKVFTNLAESDLKFVRTQLSKNVPSEENRFEDYVIAFTDEELNMLFECVENVVDNGDGPVVKQNNQDIVVGTFLSTKIIESIIDSNNDYASNYLDFDKEKIETVKKAFESGDFTRLSYSKLGFLYPNHSDIWYLANHAHNTIVLNFIVDNLEDGVESDTMLQEKINDYLATDSKTITRVFTQNDRLITPYSSSKHLVQPIHDYDLVTGIDYTPSM